METVHVVFQKNYLYFEVLDCAVLSAEMGNDTIALNELARACFTVSNFQTFSGGIPSEGQNYHYCRATVIVNVRNPVR
jgi:hypothetical protein